MSWKRRLLRVLLGLILLLVAGVAILWIALRSPKPTNGVAGPEADELARRIQREVKLDDWPKTGAITWTHAKRNNHLWDRRRNFDRIRFQDGSTVLLDINRRDGIVTGPGGENLEGEEKRKGIEKAYRWWINDTFWLNPFTGLFGEGVTRQKVSTIEGEPGAEGLLVSWASGGVTPGDSYLWIVPPSGPPKAWRMWVSVLPIGGLHVTWEKWKELESGGVVSTEHDLAGLTRFELGELKAAATLAELTGGTDPFAALGGAPIATSTAAAPSSQPAR